MHLDNPHRRVHHPVLGHAEVPVARRFRQYLAAVLFLARFWGSRFEIAVLTRSSALRAATLSLACVLTAAACTSPTDQAVGDLREQRERWEALGLARYAYDFRRVCFCGGPIGTLRVTVRDDTLVSVTDVATGRPPSNLPAGWAGTIDQIFDEILRDAKTAASVDLSFDDRYHFPAHARVDRIKNAIDDEYELELSTLIPSP